MNSIFLSHSLLSRPALHPLALGSNIQPQCNSLITRSTGRSISSNSFPSPIISRFLRCRVSSVDAATPSEEGTIPVLNFEDFVEKDWSFLDTDDINVDDEHKQKTERIIYAGEIKETSRILVSLGSEAFVDQIVGSSSCQQLVVVHDSLFQLAMIKEKYDTVKCWQGELIYVPEKFAPFDVVFLYFLPGLPFGLDQVVEAIAKHCLPGARVVISHPQGRKMLEHQRMQFPEVVVSDVPDSKTLQKVANDHAFQIVEFVDEPAFYLAVLKFQETGN